jgi:NADPH:quinone reductase-like Zn-dependent oxidoreductase
VVGPDQVTTKPANMSWEVAAGFSAGAQTADIGLKEVGVGAGDTVLIHGAAGAVGTIAVQLSRLWGATVIGAARESQHGYLRSLGAIPIAYGDRFTDRVRALAPQGVHACLDGVGGEALDASLELVKDRSRILTLVEHGKASQLGIRTTPLTRSAARLAELAELYAQGKLTVHILETFPLGRAGDAHRAYRAGNIRGKIVITID